MVKKIYYCCFCNRTQPDSEAGNGGAWAYIAGSGGKIACPKCTQKHFGVKPATEAQVCKLKNPN